MCSIYGVIGRKETINEALFDRLRAQAGDRGRDGGRYESYELLDGRVGRVGNWRATPTPEREHAPLQPYDGVVHNGTIANDRELGARPGEVDSMVLPRILDRSSLQAFARSIRPIKGSYAIAAVAPATIYLACNYKPIHYARIGGAIYFSSMERHFTGVLSPWLRPQKLSPYSVLDLSSDETEPLPRWFERRAVVIASTGLDSTVVAAKLRRDDWHVHLLHFRYGCQAEPREAERLERIAGALGCSHSFLDFNFAAQLRARSTLFGDAAIGGAIEGAEYAIDWVPARNLVMLSLAVAFAESNDYHAIALGNNLEEAGAYPDNEEEFTNLFNGLMPYAVRDGYRLEVLSPVGHLMKHEIVRLGLELGAPLEHTWSCYRAEEKPCGMCGPCFMRREAFRRNKVKDPTFDDGDVAYWQDCAEYHSCCLSLAPNAAARRSRPSSSADAGITSRAMTTR
jgi:7-cyano-7-deazaguanine synthase